MFNSKLINFKNLLIFILIYTLFFFLYRLYSYSTAEKALHANIRQELLHGANSVPLILKSTYHDDNLLANKPTYAQDFENIKNLTQFIRNTRLAYVYSFIRDKNNIIRFSSSSAKEKDLEQNSSDIYSFDTYTDPQLQELFNTTNFNQPLFNHSKDKQYCETKNRRN